MRVSSVCHLSLCVCGVCILFNNGTPECDRTIFSMVIMPLTRLIASLAPCLPSYMQNSISLCAMDSFTFTHPVMHSPLRILLNNLMIYSFNRGKVCGMLGGGGGVSCVLKYKVCMCVCDVNDHVPFVCRLNNL